MATKAKRRAKMRLQSNMLEPSPKNVSARECELISMALSRLLMARTYLREAGSKKAADYVARALKSTDGARRHAKRMAST